MGFNANLASPPSHFFLVAVKVMLCLESRSEKRKKNIFTLRLRLGLAGTHFISRLKCNKVAFNVLKASVMREEAFVRLGSATVGKVVVNAGR